VIEPGLRRSDDEDVDHTVGKRSHQQGCGIRKAELVDILWLIIGGVVIGLLGKFVAPGDKDNIPLWLTVLCGIGGIILGYYIYAAFGGDGSGGVDWVRWIVAIIVSAVLVVIASTVTGRNTGSRTRV
jgi:uncharacterized membrane protein YeaQ/YmgE (transglycosylase-associated protein family)